MTTKSKKYSLQQIRVIKNMTQKELADKSGISERSINSYEKDINRLRQAKYVNVKKLADALNVKVDDIFLNPNSEILNKDIKS